MSLLRWATAAVPGTRPFGFLFLRGRARSPSSHLPSDARKRRRARAPVSPRRRVSRRTRPPLRARWAPADLAVPPLPRLSSLICSAASADRQPGQRTGDVTLPLGVPRRGPARCVSFEATRHIAIEPRHRSRARDGDALLEPPRPSARPPRRRFPSITQKRFLRRSRIRRRSRFPKTKRKGARTKRRARSVTRGNFFDSNVMRGFFFGNPIPENAFFIHRRTTLTPLLFPSPKHRRFVIHDERERHVGFGVPTHRRRVFIVASLHGDPRDVLLSRRRGARASAGRRAVCATRVSTLSPKKPSRARRRRASTSRRSDGRRCCTRSSL